MFVHSAEYTHYTHTSVKVFWLPNHSLIALLRLSLGLFLPIQTPLALRPWGRTLTLIRAWNIQVDNISTLMIFNLCNWMTSLNSFRYIWIRRRENVNLCSITQRKVLTGTVPKGMRRTNQHTMPLNLNFLSLFRRI